MRCVNSKRGLSVNKENQLANVICNIVSFVECNYEEDDKFEGNEGRIFDYVSKQLDGIDLEIRVHEAWLYYIRTKQK